MAEFCKDCADELGFKKHDEPCFCEGCGKHIDNRIITKIKRFFKKNSEYKTV